jgi:hypothetical protein
MSATMQAERSPTTTTTPRPDLLGWGTVRAGLGVSFFGTLLTLLCPILIFFVGWTLRGQQHPSVLHAVALITFTLGWLGGGMLFITGVCMGAAAPPGSGTRGWSICACFVGPISVVALGLLAVLLTVADIRLDMENERAAHEVDRILLPQEAKRPLPGMPDAVFGPKETKIIVLVFEGVFLLTLLFHLLALRGIASAFHRSNLSVAVICFMLSSIAWVSGLNVLGLREEELSPRKLQQLILLLLAGLGVLKLWYLVMAALVRRAIGEGLLQGNP